MSGAVVALCSIPRIASVSEHFHTVVSEHSQSHRLLLEMQILYILH